ncbi:MAG TPA: hypothetical protein DCZ94_04145 [Lentisphaeria bacterium]|nr:MAG: hypothetical protein A2X48_05365 [Lentisphaerae bacterium GWF2_49_21]HBC86127.1 hypothetical protein [Lentisphaeria bacterium]
MDSKEFKVSCPKCKAVFSVPLEFAGEAAECAECEFVFEIPKPDQAETENYNITETGTITGVEINETIAKGTVRLSRTSIGMIPTMKDKFNFDGQAKPLPPKEDDF